MSKHYFATCVMGWAVSTDPATAVDSMARGLGGKKSLKGVGYWVFEVPLPLEAPYHINNYVPEVDGVVEVLKGEF